MVRKRICSCTSVIFMLFPFCSSIISYPFLVRNDPEGIVCNILLSGYFTTFSLLIRLARWVWFPHGNLFTHLSELRFGDFVMVQEVLIDAVQPYDRSQLFFHFRSHPSLHRITCLSLLSRSIPGCNRVYSDSEQERVIRHRCS